MQSKFFKKIILTNLGFAMFGTPVALLFMQMLKETTLANAIGVVFVFFAIFMVMHIGLELIIRHIGYSNGRE
jgi:mannose/fructose/N-acetylgalactosamine-specific phosphotransferase system component IID